MDPQVGVLQQVVVGVAEAGGAILRAVARIGAAQAGREMRHHDGLVPISAWLPQLGLQPCPARQRFESHTGRVEWDAVVGRAHHFHEVATGAQRRGAPGRAEQIEITPAHSADEANALAVQRGQDHAFAFDQSQRQRFAAGAQRRPGLRQVALVELVVAGDEKHRNRPVAKQRQARPGAVDVAGQHQQFGAGGGLGLEQFRLEVQVRQQLQPHHAIRRACFKPPLAPSA